MLPLLISLCFAADTFSADTLQADLIGQTVQVQGKDWTFAEGKGESTKVVLKGFTPKGRRMEVTVELDCHLC